MNKKVVAFASCHVRKIILKCFFFSLSQLFTNYLGELTCMYKKNENFEAAQ